MNYTQIPTSPEKEEEEEEEEERKKERKKKQKGKRKKKKEKFIINHKAIVSIYLSKESVSPG